MHPILVQLVVKSVHAQMLIVDHTVTVIVAVGWIPFPVHAFVCLAGEDRDASLELVVTLSA